MAALYRLTCPHCTVEIEVPLTQAGGTTPCVCGEVIAIPKMLDLKKLPQVGQVSASDKKRNQWSPIQGGVFGLGVLLIAIGGYLHFQVAAERGGLQVEQPEFDEYKGDLSLMTESQAWGSWVQLRTLKLENRATPQFLQNRVRFKELTTYIYLAWSAAAVGGVLMLVSFFIGGRQGSRRIVSK